MNSIINYQTMSLCDLNNELVMCCQNNNVEGIKYLLNSDDLLEHPDIHYKRDEPFKTAVKHKSVDVIEFLIFTLKIENNINIKSFILNKNSIKKMFEIRELSNKLAKPSTKQAPRNKI